MASFQFCIAQHNQGSELERLADEGSKLTLGEQAPGIRVDLARGVSSDLESPTLQP